MSNWDTEPTLSPKLLPLLAARRQNRALAHKLIVPSNLKSTLIVDLQSWTPQVHTGTYHALRCGISGPLALC